MHKLYAFAQISLSHQAELKLKLNLENFPVLQKTGLKLKLISIIRTKGKTQG